jgi:hypothetical protein
MPREITLEHVQLHLRVMEHLGRSSFLFILPLLLSFLLELQARSWLRRGPEPDVFTLFGLDQALLMADGSRTLTHDVSELSGTHLGAAAFEDSHLVTYRGR